MARNLTDRQKKFLDVLFEEANGDAVTAKKLAGYSDNTPTVATLLVLLLLWLVQFLIQLSWALKKK